MCERDQQILLVAKVPFQCKQACRGYVRNTELTVPRQNDKDGTQVKKYVTRNVNYDL